MIGDMDAAGMGGPALSQETGIGRARRTPATAIVSAVTGDYNGYRCLVE
jgi:hypothetical protein